MSILHVEYIDLKWEHFLYKFILQKKKKKQRETNKTHKCILGIFSEILPLFHIVIYFKHAHSFQVLVGCHVVC